MAKSATVELAPGVWRIPLIGDYVNGFMLRDDDGQVTLIDMGIASSGKKVIAALRSIGSDPSDVTRLMLTHCHPDHAGGTAYVSEQTGRSVDVHADDAEFVRTGTQPDVDPTSRIGKLFRKLPEPKVAKVARRRGAHRRPGGPVRRRDPGDPHTGALTGPRLLPARALRHADHRGRHLQRAGAALADEDALHELRDDQADRAPARRASSTPPRRSPTARRSVTGPARRSGRSWPRTAEHRRLVRCSCAVRRPAASTGPRGPGAAASRHARP